MLFVIMLFLTSIGAYIAYFIGSHYLEITYSYMTPITLL